MMSEVPKILRWLTVATIGWFINSAPGVATVVYSEPTFAFTADIDTVADGCALEIVWRESDGARARLLARTDGTATFEANSLAWRIAAGKPPSFLIEGWAGGRTQRLAAVGSGNALAASFNDSVLDALALAETLSIEQDGREVAKLPFDVGALWVARLRACVGSVKLFQPKVRTPAAHGRPATAGDLRIAIPRGNPAGWVTKDDYPPRALREARGGTTRIAAAIDVTGRLSNCTVTLSSGSLDLDDRTCRNVVRRARFRPAVDEAGAPIADPAGLAMLVHWVLPDASFMPMPIKWPVTAGWTVAYELRDAVLRSPTCTMERTLRNAGGTRLRVVTNLSGGSTIELIGRRLRHHQSGYYATSSGRDGKRLLWNTRPSADVDGKIELTASGEHPLVALAEASRLGVELNRRNVLDISLDGVAPAIVVVGRCVALAKAAQLRASMWRDFVGLAIVERVAP